MRKTRIHIVTYIQNPSSSETQRHIQTSSPSGRHRSHLPSRLVVRNDTEALPFRQLGTNLLLVVRQSSSVVDLLESLAGKRSAHIGRLGGREEGAVTQGVDALLPFLAGFLGRVDEFNVLADAVVDCVADPAALDLYDVLDIEEH